MTRFHRGFGLIELVIATGIVAITLLVFAQAAITFLRAAQISADDQDAAFLAREGMEAVRAVRDQSWSSNIAVLANDTIYYATATSGSWILTTSNPGQLLGKFTRAIIFSAVNRSDGGFGDIVATGGTLDPKTKKVLVRVQWTGVDGSARTFDLTSYLTYFLRN